MAWYQLFFQFADVAEATIRADDWAWLRMFSRSNGDIGQWIEDLSRPGALTGLHDTALVYSVVIAVLAIAAAAGLLFEGDARTGAPRPHDNKRETSNGSTMRR